VIAVIAPHSFIREEHTMNMLSMTPAALLHFLTLATQHALTDTETHAAVRAACGERRECIALVAVEVAIADVLATREVRSVA